MNTSPITHPAREPIFSWSRSEDHEHQRLRVVAVFDDNSRDWQEEIIGATGEWVPSEVEEEFIQRLTRLLVHRHTTRMEEAKSI